MNIRLTAQRFLYIFVILAACFGSSDAFAQSSGIWQPDQRVPGYLDDTFTPFLVADQNRTVHAFGSQRPSEALSDRAIIYSRWSLSGGWTAPVDVILSPVGEAQIQSAMLDNQGTMHLIFWGGSARDAHIFYTYAPIEGVGRGTSWSEPVIIGEKAGGTSSAYLAGDDAGNLVMAYSGRRDGNGVYYSVSTDHGQTWTKAEPFFLTEDIDLVPFSIRLAVGENNQVHATWNVVTSRGTDISLHFANFDLTNLAWGDVITLNTRVGRSDYFGPSFPSMVDNGSEIVIMYNNGNPYSGRPVEPGRPIQMVSSSGDGGNTWNVPVVPFYLHVGRSGEHSLVLDSNNTVHALFVQRIESTVNGEYRVISGVFHSMYQNGIWSDPNRFLTTYAAHDVRAVVSQGNVLLVVWRQDPGATKLHGVWFSYTTLDSPELPVIANPTLPDLNSSSSDLTAIPTADTEIATPSVPLGRSVGLSGNPAGALILATCLVAVLLFGMVIVYSLNRNRPTQGD